MDEDGVEYRPMDDDDERWDRYVRYAFRPTEGPYRSRDDGDGDAGPTVERPRRGLFPAAGGDPYAVAGYHDFRTRIRDEYHRVGGVSAVATPPEHRRRGYVRALMAEMLAEFREEGIHFSALWPFKRSFYRRLGWGTCSRYVTVEAPPAQFWSAGADPAGEFRRVDADDWETLVPVHEAHDAGRGLHVDRTEAWWRARVFSGWGGDPFVYRWDDATGDPRAYVTYTVSDGEDGRRLRVREAAWADAGAYRHLCRFLGDHDSQVDAVRLTAAFDSGFTLLDAVDDPSASTVEVHAGHMARLADVAGSLRALEYPGDVREELRLAVSDPLVDANDRTFALSVADGRADCAPVDGDGEPDVALGVGHLSQLAVGYRDASTMAAAGHLDAPEDRLASLDACFPAEPVWLRERF